jgi:hypothetical protein
MYERIAEISASPNALEFAMIRVRFRRMARTMAGWSQSHATLFGQGCRRRGHAAGSDRFACILADKSRSY